MERTKVNISTPEGFERIQFDSTIVTLGSCFSDEIGKLLIDCKYDVLANPFGTVFNPVSIEWLIDSFSNKTSTLDIIEHDQYFFAYELHSELFGESEDELNRTFSTLRSHVKSILGKATHVIITLGSSWVYVKKDTGKIVSNCHKQSQQLFQRRLLSKEEIESSLTSMVQKLNQLNPNIQIIFTISPVRHTKEGLVENMVSKSQLATAVYYLAQQQEKLAYFPAYELMIDELRDYSYYNEDLIHPNRKAIAHIWERFIHNYLDEQELKWLTFWEEIKKALHHKTMLPKSSAYKKHIENTLHKISKSPYNHRLDKERIQLETLLSSLSIAD